MTIPQALLERKQWLVWRLEKDAKHPEKKKLLKVPYYTDGGRRYGDQGTERDRRRLAVHAAAMKAAPAEGVALGGGGIGFAFLPGDGLIGIDLDNMIDPGTGEISPRALEIIRDCDSYTEYSPSGKGMHIFVLGETETSKSNKVGVEMFCGRQYFTVTGKHYSGSPLEVRPVSAEALRKLHALLDEAKGRAKPEAPRPPAENDFAKINDAAIANLDAWVPALFPSARRAPKGYRVSSADLGRDLEEDLSITSEGIVDWGVNDMGDARQGRRTPIDLVIEWSSNKTAKAALQWLAGQLGKPLASKPARAKAAAPPADDGGPPGDEPPLEGEPGDEDRPVIKWTQGDLHHCVDEAEAALLESGLRIYQRAGFLVRVVRRDTPSVRHYKRRPPGSLGIVTVDTPYLIEALTRAARWLKWSSQKNAFVPTNAPEQAAVTYLSRRGHWRLPRLWSAISAPTLRPDGTLLQEPGYDVDTQSWYDPCGIEFPKIPESPDQDEAERALKVFEEAFASFPFDSKADKSVALALALTALVRRSLPSAPLGGITAPAMGTGKTLLADCISILATGISAPAMKYADTDEEATKTMLAILAEGDQVVLIDNVERPLHGAELCAVLTSETYRQRMLGKTEMMTVPTTTLWLATGNHLVVQGDLRTRALLCRMDAKTEHPEQRQFDVEKRAWMTQHRPELVAAGLTVMRAFIATGQDTKEACNTWGRFERWSDMVRAPLIWLGCEDPCASLKGLEKDDPERIELLRAIAAWEACFQNEARTAGEAVTEANRGASEAAMYAGAAPRLYQVMREICKERDGTLSARRLGHWLGKHADRLVSVEPAPGEPRARPSRFVRAGEKDHSVLWKVETMS